MSIKDLLLLCQHGLVQVKSFYLQKKNNEPKAETNNEKKPNYIPLAERPYLKELGGSWDCSQAGKTFAMPYRQQKTTTGDKKNANQKNLNFDERTALEILGGKMMWDKAGTGFSMPYQKPEKTKSTVEGKVEFNKETNYSEYLNQLLVTARKSIDPSLENRI